MKTLLTFALVFLISFGVKSQEKPTPLYLLFEFMHVEGQHGNDYWDVENFWSGIHKQRVADKSIIGWDLWSLTPSGTEQGSQFLTVTLFSSLENMLKTIQITDIIAYAHKAYPKMTEKELNTMFDKTVKSRDIANQVFLKQVDKTIGDFTMKVGTVGTIDVMKQLDNSYESVESEIFKPWHQEMVSKGKKGNWELLRAIFPAGSEAGVTHITIDMFNDVSQLSSYMESAKGDDMDMKTSLAVIAGIKTRDWKEKKMITLQLMVR